MKSVQFVLVGGGYRMDVFILWHVHEMSDGEDDAKLIGVYATAEDAVAARLRVLDQPGFRELPEGFHVDRHTVGEDHWTEGYITEFASARDDVELTDDLQPE